MNNRKKYIKLCNERREKTFEKWGYYYPPNSFEEFEKLTKESYEKY